jgi:hypothetical protein
MRSAVTSVIVVFALAAASPAAAGAGALYSVPKNPPPETDAVGFTNSLNKGVPGVPAALSHTPELTPQQVEARARLLERGVAIRAQPARELDRRTEILLPVGASSFPGREPLLAAFLAAGALALAGLALAAKRRRHGDGLRSAG